MSLPGDEQRRRSFGAAATTYARLRPGYPDDLVTWVLDGARRPIVDVADVGAGTGALTRSLVDRASSVVAFEPDAAMIAELAADVPTARAVRSVAEHLPVPDASYDAILVAAAWHWFDDVAAARELRRALRAGGVVGVLWHVRDDREGWMHELTDAIAGAEGMRDEATGERMAARMREVMPGVELRSEPTSVAMTPDDVVGLVSTYSTVILDPDADALRERVRELLRTHPETRGRATVDMRYVVRAYRWCP